MTEHRRLRSRDLFPTDGPVPADLLIGRATDVDVLANALSNGLNRILVGPRRTGKTSVALATLAEVEARGSYVVHVDLFRLSGAAELAEGIVRGVLRGRPAGRRASGAVRRAGRALSDAAARAVSVKVATELGADVEIAFTQGLAARDPERYLTYAFELLQRVADLDGVTVVLFVDEFQEIASPRAPFGEPDALTKRMRAILQSSPQVTCLFAGSIEHAMRDLFTPQQRAFYQFGAFDALSDITDEQWREGLASRYLSDGLSITDAALGELLRRSEGHPRTTMLIAQQTHALTALLQLREVDSDLVLEAYAEALAADSGSHASETERVRELSKHSFVVCRRLARGDAPYPGSPKASAHRALEALERAGVIERVPEAVAHTTGGWRLVDPLFRDYLATL
jgi:hypothetical protein